MSTVKIGWASRDVSSAAAIHLPGQLHVRISQGILDPVTTTVLVLDDGADSVIFVSMDVSSIRSFLVDDVCERTAELDDSIPVEKIVMNATHTHTGVSHLFDGKPSERDLRRRAQNTGFQVHEVPTVQNIASSDDYRVWLTEQISGMIVEAWRGRRAGGVAWGYGYAVVAHSRRVVYFDDVSQRPGPGRNAGIAINGHAVMYGNTNDPQFSGYEAGADPFVNLLYTFDADGALSGAIVNVPCPSQNSEMMYQVSASYWHETRKAIRARHGDIFILPQCAAAGDLAPRILHYKKAQERRFLLKYGRERAFAEEFERLDIGERIADAFTEVLEWAKKDIRTDLPVRHTVETIQLDRRRITKEEYESELSNLADFEKEPWAEEGTPEERFYHDSMLCVRRARCRGLIARYHLRKTQPDLPSPVHIVQIGDIAFATNRFELYMDYMHRIQARSPFEQTFIVQLCGAPGPESGTYIATERGDANKGYSASRYCNHVSPQGGRQLTEESLRLLYHLKQQN